MALWCTTSAAKTETPAPQTSNNRIPHLTFTAENSILSTLTSLALELHKGSSKDSKSLCAWRSSWNFSSAVDKEGKKKDWHSRGMCQ